MGFNRLERRRRPSNAATPRPDNFPTTPDFMTFPELSEQAQNAIVDAIMGQPVATLPESVRAEIKAWAETDERIGVRVDGISA